MKIRDWFLRLLSVVRPGQAERDLQDELSFHIECETQRLVDQGVAPDEARLRARRNFGSPSVVADECRDQRGTALIDSCVSDLRYAFRTFRKAPLAALTIVGTVALGLGAVAVLFTLLNGLLFKTDAVPNVSEIFSIDRRDDATGNIRLFSRDQFEALRRETTVFSETFASVAELDQRVDGVRMSVTLVTSEFFPLTAVHPIMGRPFAAVDDNATGGQPVLVLSAKGWQRHFDRDPGIIGRVALLSGVPYTIIGVMPEGFRGLHVDAPDAWAPLARASDFIPEVRAGAPLGVEVVGRLRQGVSRSGAVASLAAWDRATATPPYAATTLDLVPRQGTVPQPLEVVAVFAPLFCAFGLILLIGCANVANLMLARGVARQREIGVRLSLGASRGRIVRQLLLEGLVLALAAAAAGYVVSRLVLEGAVAWARRITPLDLGDVNLAVPAADWRVALFLVVVAVLATTLFALMPALQATRIDPVRTLRGELVRQTGLGRARNVLIGAQVFASALLLICSAVFLRSAFTAAQFDPGFRTADTVLIDIINEPSRDAMLQAVATDATVQVMAGVRPPLLAQPSRARGTGGSAATLTYRHVSAEYFSVLGIPIVRGRAFSPAEGDDDAVAVVSEATARALWADGGAIGRTLHLEPDSSVQQSSALLTINPGVGKDTASPPPRALTVVGVSKDVAGFRFTDVREAGVFLPTVAHAHGTFVVARLRGDVDRARQGLLERLVRIDPNMGQVITLKTVARMETFFLTIAFWVSVILGGLALLLTVSGLYSVLSYLVEQRQREVAVRMALGASIQHVTQMVLSQTARPVLAGLLAGAALAAVLARALMATEVGSIIARIVQVTDPIAYLSSALVILAACVCAGWVPARRAAKVDPMTALRRD